MYLVDTSVWIDYLNNITNSATQTLEELLSNRFSFGISSHIYQEIIQGANDKKTFNQLCNYFSTQHFYEPNNIISSYQKAAEMYFNCRKKGLTIRSSIDCLIAQIALEHDLVLLHQDKDFIRIQSIVPKLKLAPSSN